ncbi:MAG: helix-turn-helix transcriptional regulator [Clostridia bacterium]|nr:helix-turn-helix transcriptional regulator [Clostridia bacterium]
MENNFAKTMVQLRKQNGLSQKQAAEHLGISQALLSHYEKGIRECGLDFLIKAAGFYSVSTDYLLGISENPQGSAMADAVDDSINDYPDLQKSRRQIVNCLNIIYSMTARMGNTKVHAELGNLLSLYIYHILRILETVSRTKNKENFEIPTEKSIIITTGYESIYQARLADRLDTSSLTRGELMALRNILSFDSDALTKNYPLQAKSLLSLVAEVELKLKKYPIKGNWQ